MSAILAIFHRDNSAVDPADLSPMLAACPERGPDGQGSWINRNIAAAHQHFWITPEEWEEQQPLIEDNEHLVISADARLDNRDDLLISLGINGAEQRRISDCSLILTAYRRWGTACVGKLLGDFAFIIWDAHRQQLFAARDSLGAFGLCYYVDTYRFLAASQVDQLLAHPAVSPLVNEGKIADFLDDLSHNHNDTYYQDIYYCPPAHCILVTADSFRKWRYWDINPQNQIRYKDERDYAAHFLHLLTGAVRSRLRTVGPVGISLSGGLDSGSLAALASSLLPSSSAFPKRLKSFSYVFDELESCDERRYFHPLVSRYDIESIEIPCDDKWTFSDFPNWPVYPAFIYWDPYTWLPNSVMRAAQKEDCRLLLAGYFGDDLSDSGRYWAASMIADLRLGDLVRTMLTQRPSINLRQDILLNGIHPRIPSALRTLYGQFRQRRQPVFKAAFHPDFIARTRLANRRYFDYHPGFAPGSEGWLRRRSMLDNFTAQGASSIRFMYNYYGLELSTPYLDRRLVEYVMAVPSDQLGRPGRSRMLFRSAMAESLPAAVSERVSKTSFSSLLIAGLRREQALVKGIMDKSLIVEYNIVKEAWLKERLPGGRYWLNQQELYHFWKCLSLELWLKVIN